MTFYNLPGVDAKVEFDPKAKVLTITGITEQDKVTTHSRNGYTQQVTVELR